MLASEESGRRSRSCLIEGDSSLCHSWLRRSRWGPVSLGRLLPSDETQQVNNVLLAEAGCNPCANRSKQRALPPPRAHARTVSSSSSHLPSCSFRRRSPLVGGPRREAHPPTTNGSEIDPRRTPYPPNSVNISRLEPLKGAPAQPQLASIAAASRRGGPRRHQRAQRHLHNGRGSPPAKSCLRFLFSLVQPNCQCASRAPCWLITRAHASPPPKPIHGIDGGSIGQPQAFGQQQPGVAPSPRGQQRYGSGSSCSSRLDSSATTLLRERPLPSCARGRVAKPPLRTNQHFRCPRLTHRSTPTDP